MIVQLASRRRGRWALSFADLALLLLGFFVLLQVDQSRDGRALAEIGGYFGADLSKSRIELRQADIFVEGEAMLNPTGKQKIAAIARQAKSSQQALVLGTRGVPNQANRFDAWDMSAARLGAVARVASAHGLDPSAIIVGTVAQTGELGDDAVILLETRPLANRK